MGDDFDHKKRPVVPCYEIETSRAYAKALGNLKACGDHHTDDHLEIPAWDM